MNENTLDPQTFYRIQGQISDPGQYRKQLDIFPKTLPELVQTIQGLMLHMHWASRYGVTLSKARKEEASLRTIQARILKLNELSEQPLSERRLLTEKTVGTCRDFALLLTSVLRHQGIPARARAGFGTYFTKGRFEDHWVCEYWHTAEKRWVMVDPQLDPMQIETLQIDFDPLDMPRTKFITGPQAWQRCRKRTVDPNRFGIFNMHGLDFVKGDLIRDFLSLNKVEILPWDNFLLIDKKFRAMSPKEKGLMDRLARISTGEDRDFVLLRASFTTNQEKLLPRYFK